MYKLEIENNRNELLTLTQNESNYQIESVDGLTPPKANIYTTAIANMDGEKFKSSRLEMRNLVINMHIKGEVEKNRIYLYRFFKTGQWCKIYYSNGTRRVYIEGYVETMESDLFAKQQVMQISVVCPSSFFKSVKEIYADVSKLVKRFEFPFTIGDEGEEFESVEVDKETIVINEGEVSTGFLLRITAKGGIVRNPTLYNVVTARFLRVNIELNEGDVLEVSTLRGNKFARLVRGIEVQNVINLIDVNSEWLELNAGATNFTYHCEAGELNALIEVEAHTLYEGV